MTQKRNSHSSVISVEDENIDLLDYDSEKEEDDYIETDLGTDNIEDIIKRLNIITKNVGYRKILEQANNNWLELSDDEVIDTVISYFKSLSSISV